jgi:hypothetical protein
VSAPPFEVSQLELDSLLDLEVRAATRQPVRIPDLPGTASARPGRVRSARQPPALRVHRHRLLPGQGKNIFNVRGPIISPQAHAFDYRIPPRQLLGVVEIDL